MGQSKLILSNDGVFDFVSGLYDLVIKQANVLFYLNTLTT
jgi:hypothetical protein